MMHIPMLIFAQVNMLTNKLHPCTLTSMAEDGSIYPDLRSRLATDLRRISRCQRSNFVVRLLRQIRTSTNSATFKKNC